MVREQATQTNGTPPAGGLADTGDVVRTRTGWAWTRSDSSRGRDNPGQNVEGTETGIANNQYEIQQHEPMGSMAREEAEEDETIPSFPS